MSLSKTEIEGIAHLARLATDENVVPDYQRDMGNILQLVEQMNVVNTDNVPALAHPLEITARLRADEISEENQREKFQQIAPAVENGYYLVPKVIE